MKKVLPLVLLGLSLSSSLAYADVLPEGQTLLDGCAVVQNTSAFTGTKFIVSFLDMDEKVPHYVEVLDDSTCVHAGKFTTVRLYAVDAKEYEKNSQKTDYDPELDVNAYPVLGGPNAVGFDTSDAYVDLPTQDTTLQRYYAVTGIDNSKRSISLKLLGEKTDTKDSRTQPEAVPANMNSIQISTPIFGDITTSSPYALALANLKRNGSIQGYADGTFKPASLINRAEFTKIMMANYTSSETYDCAVAVFSDVSAAKSNWYRNPVCAAFHEGVIAGYSDHTFKPEQNINYAEAAKIIVNAFGVAPSEKTDPWYLQFTNVFDSINGKPSTVQAADQKITRGEMALMMYNFTGHALELQ
jgi:hypothetical protein